LWTLSSLCSLCIVVVEPVRQRWGIGFVWGEG
jgi:hypothetical protein